MQESTIKADFNDATKMLVYLGKMKRKQARETICRLQAYHYKNEVENRRLECPENHTNKDTERLDRKRLTKQSLKPSFEVEYKFAVKKFNDWFHSDSINEMLLAMLVHPKLFDIQEQPKQFDKLSKLLTEPLDPLYEPFKSSFLLLNAAKMDDKNAMIDILVNLKPLIINLSAFTFRGFTLKKLDLSYADFSYSQFCNSEIRECNCYCATFDNFAPDSDCNITKNHFIRASIRNIGNKQLTNQAQVWSKNNFTDADLSGSQFEHSKCLQESVLTRAKLNDCMLEGIILVGHDLTGVNFSNSYLDRANLSGSNLTNANLTNVSASQINLNGVTFDNTCLKNVDLSGALIDHKTTIQNTDLGQAKLPVDRYRQPVIRDLHIKSAKSVTDFLFLIQQIDKSGVLLLSEEYEKIATGILNSLWKNQPATLTPQTDEEVSKFLGRDNSWLHYSDLMLKYLGYKKAHTVIINDAQKTTNSQENKPPSPK